ncbi:YicC/YloC family endoribonuclease [Clostridium cellulovorans]|uniref:YicC-like domain-containing protein n=1 Tax=Clostridium cellulovorans (strain ATCC 35296 / DSM 3052 / OCM 3 / 743B) TaxID=573061 RepID=D9SL95_CLOC7|nr:YicC/YloC family endoribonuclease [Clostridium cellulovorans]ADL51611.1 YicC-like domain-containing protein [Clostridium cellulovorans 743B]
MMKSMTGFGRANEGNENFAFTVEMKGVNHRYLDLNIRMPRSILSLEDKVRKVLQEKLNRGKIDVFITEDNYNSNAGIPMLNEALARNYITSLNKLRDEFSLKDDISVSLVAKFPEVITLKQEEKDIDEIWYILKTTLECAVNNFLSMREKEGQKLKDDILVKIKSIEGSLAKIEPLSSLTVENYKIRLQDRVTELLGDVELEPSRIAQEIAIFADRACIDEEIVRLKSHIHQVKDTLELKEAVGRKLDFIIQEMNRETNTISSKANNIEITNLTIAIKNDIEKIREQVQNLE